jgi:alpha-galactosidase
MCRDVFDLDAGIGFQEGSDARLGDARIVLWAASGMPVLVAMDTGGQNRATVAVADYKTPLAIKAGVNEEAAEMVFKIEFFTQLVNSIDSYETVIRLDFRDVPFSTSVVDVQKWWDLGMPPRPQAVPEAARLPVFSTWYNFHQSLDPDAIVRQCRIARELGMESIIVDDGWQTADSRRGYAFCGDWESAPEKVGEMRQFVDRIHETGLKCILWFSVPFVGVHSLACQRFQGKFLRNRGGGVWVLDPRFPEVRKYLVDLYRSRVIDYNLDGLKLDFIDAFEFDAEASLPNPARDYDSLEDAIERLLEEITESLREIRTDLCIEFRQCYVGPLMRRFGNMLRVGDCPADALRNRVGVIDLRLTSGDTPVHSDMLMWSFQESVEDASRQIIAVLFGVPQISIHLDRLPESHEKMLWFYLKFWRENRDVLLDGDLLPLAPEQNYPVVSATRDGHTIVALYGAAIYRHRQGGRRLTVINGGSTAAVAVAVDFGQTSGPAMCESFDCMGNVLERTTIEDLRGLREFQVPVGGILNFEGDSLGLTEY